MFVWSSELSAPCLADELEEFLSTVFGEDEGEESTTEVDARGVENKVFVGSGVAKSCLPRVGKRVLNIWDLRGN